jgi:hypothetical protein
MNQVITQLPSSFGRVRQMIRSDAESFLDTLSNRQFLHPHDALASALSFLAQHHLVNPRRVMESASHVGLPLDTAMGRLKRIELTRLARIVARDLGLSSECDRIPD